MNAISVQPGPVVGHEPLAPLDPALSSDEDDSGIDLYDMSGLDAEPGLDRQQSELANLHRLTMTPAYVFSGNADAAVRALQKPLARSSQTCVHELQAQTSFVNMVNYVRTLTSDQASQLLRVSKSCRDVGEIEASQLLAVLFLFACCSPRKDCEFESLLPFTWPPGLREWREPCMTDWRQSMKNAGDVKVQTLAFLENRYGTGGQ